MDKKIEYEYLDKADHIQSLIAVQVDNAKYYWDTTSKSYAKKIDQVDCVLSDDILREDEDHDSDSLRK